MSIIQSTKGKKMHYGSIIIGGKQFPEQKTILYEANQRGLEEEIVKPLLMRLGRCFGMRFPHSLVAYSEPRGEIRTVCYVLQTDVETIMKDLIQKIGEKGMGTIKKYIETPSNHPESSSFPTSRPKGNSFPISHVEKIGYEYLKAADTCLLSDIHLDEKGMPILDEKGYPI